MFDKKETDKTDKENKKKVTDPIFKELFSDKKYLLQLYRDLHPEDEKATADDITDVILEQVIDSEVDNLYYYLGFKVGSLIEAREAAEEMIKDNLPLEKIGEWTKLSMDELKQIEAKVKANGENE